MSGALSVLRPVTRARCRLLTRMMRLLLLGVSCPSPKLSDDCLIAWVFGVVELGHVYMVGMDANQCSAWEGGRLLGHNLGAKN